MFIAGFDIPIWLILAAVVLLLYYRLTRTYNTFKNIGIAGPTPYPLVGTTYGLYGQNMMTHDVNLWKKYGKFVGTYDGSAPVLMVFDAEWLQEAFIKNFSVFMNRRRTLQGGSFDTSLFIIEGDHWKSVRKMLSPEFSSGKIKKMMPAIQKCDDVFVNILRGHEEAPVDIRKRVNLLTLDVISTTAFGIDSQAQTLEDNMYVKNAFLLTSANQANSSILEKARLVLIVFVSFMAPEWLSKFLSQYLNLGFLDSNATNYFDKLSESVIEERKEDATGHDFIQNLVDKLVEVKKGDSETSVDEHGNQWTSKGITKQEITANTLLFLLAGFQTTADSLLFTFYELVHHPDLQQKLYEEVMSVCDTEEITIDQVNQMKYLDRVISETMRLYPQGFRFERVATEDITIRDIHVPKSTIVTASSWVIHRDPEIWESPEDFDPDRFLPERLSAQAETAYMPFGIGNRQCIGNRLALIEMKMTMIATLKAFTIAKNDQTPSRPIQMKAALAVAPENPIIVSFIPRH